MGFLFSDIFWGIVLILTGVSIILQLVFKINIPVFPIVIAFLLIYAGIRKTGSANTGIRLYLKKGILRQSRQGVQCSIRQGGCRGRSPAF